MLEHLFNDAGNGGAFEGFSVRIHFLLAQAAVTAKNPSAMMEHLVYMVEEVIKLTGEEKTYGTNAGNAFLNMAKWFDRVPNSSGKKFAMQSLYFSREIYKLSGQDPGYEGLSEIEIKDYLANPSSPVSIQKLDTRANRESQEAMAKKESSEFQSTA